MRFAEFINKVRDGAKMLSTGKNMRNSFIAILAAAALFATAASAETYICQVRPNGPDKGLISSTIAINIHDVTFGVVVSDAVILAAHGKPVVATLASYTRKRLTIKWAVQGVKDSRNNVYNEILYKLVIWKSRGNEMSVTATLDNNSRIPASTPKNLSGSGKCKLRNK